LLSNRIQERLLSSDVYRASVAIVLYAPADNEVSTDRILSDALGSGRPVFYPRYDGRQGRLALARVEALSELRPGAFGILEPSPASATMKPQDLACPALVCVPGVAFGLLGQRLGRGGGHYDRLLAEFGREVVTVGLAYSFQLLDRIPETGHDRRLHFVVTESAVHATCQWHPRVRWRADQGGRPKWTLD